MQGNEQLAIIIPKLHEIGARVDSDRLHAPTSCKDSATKPEEGS